MTPDGLVPNQPFHKTNGSHHTLVGVYVKHIFLWLHTGEPDFALPKQMLSPPPAISFGIVDQMKKYFVSPKAISHTARQISDFVHRAPRFRVMHQYAAMAFRTECAYSRPDRPLNFDEIWLIRKQTGRFLGSAENGDGLLEGRGRLAGK